MRISDWSSDVCSFDLKRGRDVRNFVHSLEPWISEALLPFGISAYAVDGRVGLWFDTPEGEAKIAAIGIRVRPWETFHGFRTNVAPDTSTFEIGRATVWERGCKLVYISVVVDTIKK